MSPRGWFYYSSHFCRNPSHPVALHLHLSYLTFIPSFLLLLTSFSYSSAPWTVPPSPTPWGCLMIDSLLCSDGSVFVTLIKDRAKDDREASFSLVPPYLLLRKHSFFSFFCRPPQLYQHFVSLPSPPPPPPWRRSDRGNTKLMFHLHASHRRCVAKVGHRRCS